jgi:hypothetical protein
MASEAYSELQIGSSGSDNRHELTDVLNPHGGYYQHMRAAFQYNLKRRPSYLHFASWLKSCDK